MAKLRRGKFPRDIEILREEIRPLLPAEAFVPQRSLLFNYLIVWLINIALVAVIFSGAELIWRSVASVTLGLSMTYTLFFTHIFIHGQVVQTVFWQKLLGWPCVYYGFISPTFWAHWHRLHHRFGTLDENVSGFQTINWIKSSWVKKIVHAIRPNQRNGESFLYLFFWKPVAFSINQLFVFLQPRFPKYVNRSFVFLELGTLAAIHVSIWWLCSWESIVLIEIVPWVIQNFISSAYVVTNHHPMLIGQGMTFRNTCTVHMNSPLIDSLVLNIGYHVEHHIFPEISPRYLPKVSKILEQRYPDEYKKVHLFSALRAIFWSSYVVEPQRFSKNTKI